MGRCLTVRTSASTSHAVSASDDEGYSLCQLWLRPTALRAHLEVTEVRWTRQVRLFGNMGNGCERFRNRYRRGRNRLAMASSSGPALAASIEGRAANSSVASAGSAPPKRVR